MVERGRGLAALSYLLATVLSDFDQAAERARDAMAIGRRAADERLVAECLKLLALIAIRRGAFDEGLRIATEATALARPLGDQLLLAELANTRGAALINLGREARPEFEESLVLAREQGDRGGMATALNNLGSIEVTAGNLDAARLRLQEALAIWRELGQLQSASSAAANLGFTLYRQGDADGAAALFLEVLFTSEREGDPGLRILSLLGLALTCPDDEAAAQRHGAVDALLEQIGYELEHVERPLHDLAKERLRASLGTESFLAAAAAGRAGNGTDAIQLRATQSDRRGSERITDTASYDARLKSAGSGSGSRAGWEQHDDQAVASGTGAHDGGGDCERCRGVGFEWPAPD